MNSLARLKQDQLALIIAPKAAQTFMLDLAGRLSISGHVRVLDGGNQFNVYPVARTIRRYSYQVAEALKNITVARAFTCYQMVAMLEELQITSTPVLVLDILSTFYDEDVKLIESKRLLHICLANLDRLSKTAPVAVSARPPLAICQERLVLLETLRHATSHYWEFDETPEKHKEMHYGKDSTFDNSSLSGGTSGFRPLPSRAAAQRSNSDG